MSDDVLLAYRRVDALYEGKINGEDFTGLTYAQMMVLARAALLLHPGAGLKLLRTEKPTYLPVLLEPALLALLLDDVVSYVHATSVPDRRIQLGKPSRLSKLAEPYQAPRSGLRAGHATLAAALGDRIYLSVRRGRVESPVTGRWIDYAELEAWIAPYAVGPEAPEALLCGEAGWVTVSTQSLLNTGTLLMYLPREWNPYGKWITRVQLQEMYASYKEESELCLKAINQDR